MTKSSWFRPGWLWGMGAEDPEGVGVGTQVWEPLDSPVLPRLPNPPVLDQSGAGQWDLEYPGNASLASSLPCTLLGWGLMRRGLDDGWGCQRMGTQLWESLDTPIPPSSPMQGADGGTSSTRSCQKPRKCEFLGFPQQTSSFLLPFLCPQSSLTARAQFHPTEPSRDGCRFYPED